MNSAHEVHQGWCIDFEWTGSHTFYGFPDGAGQKLQRNKEPTVKSGTREKADIPTEERRYQNV